VVSKKMEKSILVPVLGAILVNIISIVFEFILIKLKIINLEKIKKNNEEMNKINEELKNKMNEARKQGKIDPSIMELQSKIMKLNFEIFKEKIKISLVVALPSFLIFIQIYRYEGGFGWWFLYYLITYLITDKVFRFIAKKLKVDIDY
jgi:uncharacterized membrane protein (DUF106 family)